MKAIILFASIICALSLILKQTVDPVSHDWRGKPHNTPLTQQDMLDGQLLNASYEGDREKTEMLIAGGANVNVHGEFGFTALIDAAYQGHLEVVQKLISAGADVNATNDSLYTALMYTAFKSISYKPEIIDLLLQAGANINAQNSSGETALIIAVKDSYVLMAKKLLSSGANPTIKDESGKTAHDYARASDTLELIFPLELS